jgi:hypothetical protein
METSHHKIAERRRDVLPVSLAPRGLSRAQAAVYVGVSPSLFDRLVRDKVMPDPIRFYRRLVWDRERLDRAFAALSDGPEPQQGRPDDEWSQPAV